MRRTKIVATLGPATSSPDAIAALVRAGVDVARVNFSHGTHEEHAELFARVREAADAAGRAVAILQDLMGPKIRTGDLRGDGPVELARGDSFTLAVDEFEGDATRVSTTYAALPSDVRPGDRILLSDGLIELRVEGRSATEVRTTVVHGGTLKERQGIHLPGVAVSAPGVTEKDLRDLEFGLSRDVDFVALSFVRSAADVRRLKEVIAARGRDTPVIAKLETPDSIEALDEVLDEAFGVMVARGDLGVELSPERVPLVQKRVIEAANERARPVITATEMLESMIGNPRPTRAEASDVANAILDGSDAVMLSGETAVGAYPVPAVETMVRVAEQVDRSERHRLRHAIRLADVDEVSSSPEAIGVAVAAIARMLPDVAAIWVLTQSGTSARLVSQHRPRVPIVAFTPSERVYRRLALVWGVTPILTPAARDEAEALRDLEPLARARGLAPEGGRVILTGSHPFQAAAPTNFLKIQRLG